MLGLMQNTKRRFPPSMTRRALNLTLFVATLLSVSVIFASSAKGSENEITHVQEGEPAPFTGDLFPVEDSVKFAIKLETCEERAAIDSAHMKTIYDIELQREKDKREAMVEAEQKRTQLMRDQLAEANSWYRQPAFVAVVAVVATMTAVIGAAVLADAVLQPQIVVQ